MTTLEKGNILIIAAIIIALIFLVSENSGLRTKIHGQQSIIAEQQSQITYHKNKRDEEYAQKLTAQASLKELKLAYGNQLNQIQKDLDIQKKNIQGFFRASTATTGQGVGKVDTIIRIQDGDCVYEVSDSTKWFDIKATINRTGFNYKYVSRDSVTLVPYKVGKQTFVRGISSNPNTRITGLQGVLVSEEKRDKRFGIGPSIQVSYNNGVKITPGISVQYNLIRF